MAYKIVNDDSLTSVANAIRTKGSISGTLVFPSGFVSAIQNLPSGGSNDFVITASKDGQDNFTIDKTFAEIKSAYQDGKRLVVCSTDYIVGYYEYFDTGIPSEDYFYIIVYSYTAQYQELVETDYNYYSSSVIPEVGYTYYYPSLENATPSDVASGKTFINSSGRQTGTATPPSGTYSITSNGIYNIVSFASVDVQVSGGGNHDVEDAIVARTISGVYENSRVTSIGNYAFANCSNLTTASFPNVTSIGNYAFNYCPNLTTISFPSATSIGFYAFYQCSKLTTASFPNVTSIGNYAFNYCSNLTTISFPSTTSIGHHAFQNCLSLTTASFSNVTLIDNYAFANCSNLTTISFPSATSIGFYAFYQCSKLTTASFPNVASIGNSTFYDCSSLTTASFPLGKSFGSQCFRNCTHLESFYVLASSVAWLGASAFLSTPMSLSSYLGYFGSIYVPASLVDSYKTATNWSAYSDRITSYTG